MERERERAREGEKAHIHGEVRHRGTLMDLMQICASLSLSRSLSLARALSLRANEGLLALKDKGGTRCRNAEAERNTSTARFMQQ
jgi:hypothetical protein